MVHGHENMKIYTVLPFDLFYEAFWEAIFYYEAKKQKGYRKT